MARLCPARSLCRLRKSCVSFLLQWIVKTGYLIYRLAIPMMAIEYAIATTKLNKKQKRFLATQLVVKYFDLSK
jgi:hypothetical protein